MIFRVRLFLATLLLSGSCLQAQDSSAPSGGGKSAQPTTPVQQETVVVTGTFTPLSETEIDRSVTVIDTNRQDLLHNNWVDYLELSPSLDLRQRAPNDVQGDLSIRGSTFGQALVLLNGLRMDDVQTGHHDMDLPLPTELIQRMEILRGAGSTLYGSDAMAGSLNVITGIPEHADLHLGTGVAISESISRTVQRLCCGVNLTSNSPPRAIFPAGFAPTATTAV